MEKLKKTIQIMPSYIPVTQFSLKFNIVRYYGTFVKTKKSTWVH